MPKVVNLKTGKVRQMTEAAVAMLKKHGMWKDLDLVPDGMPAPIIKRGPKPKQVQTVITETDEKP